MTIDYNEIAREYEESRRAAMTTCDYCEAPAAWRVNSGETSLACDTCYREMFDENERASFTWEAERLADDTFPRCLGVERRFCDAAPIDGTPYCSDCKARLDRHFAVAAGVPPLHDADASKISETALPNGNILIRHGAMTIFCGSAAVLADLRAYLAWPAIEAAAERVDDALDTIAELRAA